MKNPQIVTRLNQMMADEKRAKLSVISTLIDHYKASNPLLDVVQCFDKLYDLDLYQLNDLLSDVTSDLWANIYSNLSKIHNAKD